MQVSHAIQRMKRALEQTPRIPDTHYECAWCRDTGWVECRSKNGRIYPVKFADTFTRENQRDYDYTAVAPCGFCEEGTYRGIPTEGSLKAAERWVQENVTSVVSLKGTYERAKEVGFNETVIDQAFQRVGIRKCKLAGRWVCEPVA